MVIRVNGAQPCHNAILVCQILSVDGEKTAKLWQRHKMDECSYWRSKYEGFGVKYELQASESTAIHNIAHEREEDEKISFEDAAACGSRGATPD